MRPLWNEETTNLDTLIQVPPSSEFQVPSSEFQVPSSEFQVPPSSEFQVSSSKFRVPSSKKLTFKGQGHRDGILLFEGSHIKKTET